MANKLVTFESVSEAAEALVSDGKRASTRNVINYLDGGSPNAVLGHLREWKAGRPQVTDNVIEVPETALNAIRSAMATAAEKAGKLAEEKASELEENQEELRNEVIELEKVGEAQVAKIELMASKVSSLTTESAKLADQVSQAKEAKREAEERLSLERDQERERAEKLAEGLAATKNQLENLAGVERERDDLKAELVNARDKLTESEKRAAVAESEAKAESRRSADAEKREAGALKRFETTEAKLEKQIDELKKELSGTRDDLKTAGQAAADDAEKWRETVALEHKRNAELQSERDTLSDQLAAAVEPPQKGAEK